MSRLKLKPCRARRTSEATDQILLESVLSAIDAGERYPFCLTGDTIVIGMVDDEGCADIYECTIRRQAYFTVDKKRGKRK